MSLINLRSRTAAMALATFVGLPALTCPGFAAGAPLAERAAAAEPMTSEELFRLYHGRSWIWKDGAGYFRTSKREFTAWSGRGRASSYGEGRWFITSRGRVCFRANWISSGYAGKTLSCFEHRGEGGRIYQRRDPDGEWYVFKNNPIRRDDEIRKLRAGDYVSKDLARARQAISRPQN